LIDVDVSVRPTEGQILGFDSRSGKWRPKASVLSPGGTITGELIVENAVWVDNTRTTGIQASPHIPNTLLLKTPANGTIDVGGAVVSNASSNVADDNDLTTKSYVDSSVTVDTELPRGRPSRDGLLWIVV
jgi:hypothetical protein